MEFPFSEHRILVGLHSDCNNVVTLYLTVVLVDVIHDSHEDVNADVRQGDDGTITVIDRGLPKMIVQ